jgi:hypothetical protein
MLRVYVMDGDARVMVGGYLTRKVRKYLVDSWEWWLRGSERYQGEETPYVVSDVVVKTVGECFEMWM